MSLELEYGDDVFCDVQEAGCFLRGRSPELGLRFTRAVRETCDFLSNKPYLGRLRPEFGIEGLRSWRVEGFSRYLIFYVRRQRD
jgi:plasmid stabilization system protein ParE